MRIGKNTVATVDYTLTNAQGQVLDSSKGRAPMTYLHGVGGILAGLESALDGKATGENVEVTMTPEQAYGPKDPTLVHSVPRSNFSGVSNIEVGMQFQAQGQGGGRVVTVVGVDENNVTVDANHPLAGLSLTCQATVVEVREATAEEIEHGHVCYGNGACEGCGGE